MKRLFLTILCIPALVIILNSPQLVTHAVISGIKLCLYSVIPSLLPFMVLTNIMLKYNLCEYITFFFKPFLSRIFCVSSMGCFAIIMGFTCGFPMGAKIVGDLYFTHRISKSEAGYLITFCNNCSITFLLNYILFCCLNSEIPVYKVLLLVYLPPVITGLINRFLLHIKAEPHKTSIYTTENSNALFNAVKSLSILCVYIICFTVISKWIASLSILSGMVKCVLSGLMEITSGANFIAATSIIFPVKNFLILGFTVFGGFSIMFQSFAQLPETFLKRNYAFGKIEQFVIFCILYGFFLYI